MPINADDGDGIFEKVLKESSRRGHNYSNGLRQMPNWPSEMQFQVSQSQVLLEAQRILSGYLLECLREMKPWQFFASSALLHLITQNLR